MTDLERARELLKHDRYATDATGIEIDEVGKNYAKCSMKITDIHKNALGHVMGGVAFTLADFVFAISTNFDAENPTVTTVSHISYLSAPKGDVLFGESRLIKDGKRNCFYEILITDSAGVSVAVVNVTGTHL
ncbi:MAG: PaaI family thioesterase [Clostridia bacterium]|nr:PaaI family thioesterase [Clostridia bacterium]